jgi:hypothetical protein
MNFPLFSKAIQVLAGSLFALCCISSCTKIRATEVGSELIPPIDGVTTLADTLEVYTQNFISDSIRVPYTVAHALGTITDDPIFGGTKGVINVELKPASFPYSFEVRKDSLLLDSAVMVLGYAGIFGDSLAPINLEVREINHGSAFKADSTYPNYTQFNAGTLLGGKTFPNAQGFNDSVYALREAALNQIRIPLNNAAMQRFINTYDADGAYKSDSAFKDNFAGFQVQAPNNTRSLLQVSLTDTNTKVAFYYRAIRRGVTPTAYDTLVRYFKFVPGSSASSNYILRNRAGSQMASIVSQPAGTFNNVLYLQAGPGSYATISIPGLSNLSNRVVHRAELLMEQISDPVSDAVYRVPYLFLTAYEKDSLHSRFFVPNDISLASGYVDNYSSFGGIPKYKQEGTQSIVSYNFNISRFVQGIVTKQQTPYKLVLSAPFDDYIYLDNTLQYVVPIVSGGIVNRPADGRVRLTGGANGSSTLNPKRMKLRIVYSRL